MRIRTLCVVSLALGVSIVGCRPRATRNTSRNRTNANQASTATPGTPSAKSVLNQADTALARVSQLAAEDREEPPMAEPVPNSYPRTPWGSSYVPQPNLSDYGVYEAALGAYNGREYGEALSLFSQMVASGRPSELVPNAYYWMGESYYAMGRYAESMPYFEYVTQVGPQYKRPMALYKLSRADLHLGNRQGANMWYERLRNEYPKSSLARTLARLGTR